MILRSVMLIDDNEDDNFFHKIVLTEEGITDNVIVAESGFEALQYLSSGKEIPELIFLDINMPKMNGWEFLEEYETLEIPDKTSVVIIMLTTSLNPADKEKAAKIKTVHGFETKPLSKQILNTVIEKFFPERKNTN